MKAGLDLIELRVSREEARMLMTAVALHGYNVEHLSPASLTRYRHLLTKVRRQVDEQLGELRETS